MNTLVIIRPELFSIMIMLFLITYDRYVSRFRDGRNSYFPFALTCLAHCVMALVTEITVNAEGISPVVNDICHVLFFFFSLSYSLFFLDYVMSFILPRGKLRKSIIATGGVISVVCVVVMLVSPIRYLQGNGTKYSAGLGPTLCFAMGFLFFIAADVAMLVFRKKIEKAVILTVLPLSLITLGLLLAQILVPEFLFTAQALTITAVGLFFAIENPVSKFQKQAFVDAYLNIWNRNSYEYDLKHIIAEKVRAREPLIYMIGDVNGLKAVNDTLSHRDGDRMLEAIAKTLLEKLPSAYKIYRVGGDEFAALFFKKELQEVGGEIRTASDGCSAIHISGEIPTGIAVGYAALEEGDTLEDVVRRADAMMYADKRAFYEKTGRGRRRSDQ